MSHLSRPSSSASAEEVVRSVLHREGRITFAQFMELALYHPEVGYYTSRRPRIGAAGDFYTSPELHPAFGALLARQVADVWHALGKPTRFDVVEMGAGTGALARDLLDTLDREFPLTWEAVSYGIVERSPAMVEQQRQTLVDAGVPADRVRWLHRLPSGLSGCVLSNELVDAFPVHLVTVREGQLEELFVVLTGDRLALAPDCPSTPALERYFRRLGLLPGEGCIAEVNLAALTWMRRVGRAVGRGLVITMDYGYTADDLYSPHRRMGTLLGHYRHTVTSDPFIRVGEQDLTAHVDFTSLALEGARAGLEPVGFLTQATFLHHLGLDDLLALMDECPIAWREKQTNRRNLMALVDPDGLGRVKVLLQKKSMDGYVPLGVDPGAPPHAWAHVPVLGAWHLRLPGSPSLDGTGDFEELWHEAWDDADVP